MSESPAMTLGDYGADLPAAFATGPFGSAVAAGNFRTVGIPMIRGANLSTNVGARLDESNMVYLSADSVAGFRRSIARRGDLVFTCWGTVGQIGYIDDRANFDEYVVSNKQMKMTPDPERALGLYLYYYLSQPSMLAFVQEQAIGSSVPGFNLGQLKALPVVLHDLNNQERIAALLGALDDKIAANERVAAAADNQRAACLNQASRAGRPRPLSSLARFVNGRAFTKDATGTGRVVVRIAELNSGLGASTVYNDIEVVDEHLARPGDLLFAWSGSLTVARWYRDEAIVNQHIFKVVPNDGVPIWLVDHALRTKLAEFKAVAADKATTMGHIQRRHLDEPVMVPSTEDVESLDPSMSALWDRALAAEMESLQLERTRDELLPLLMSGKLRVKDAGKIAEDVL